VWRMLIAAVLCLCAAVATAGGGLWLLSRPAAVDPVRQVLRGVAPTQLAAAVMLTAGGVVALSARPQMGLVVVVVCVIGAVCTVAAGCWQSAKAVAASAAKAAGERCEATAGCGGACASCTLSCNSA
jgi:hypothetical protein